MMGRGGRGGAVLFEWETLSQAAADAAPSKTSELALQQNLAVN